MPFSPTTFFLHSFTRAPAAVSQPPSGERECGMRNTIAGPLRLSLLAPCAAAVGANNASPWEILRSAMGAPGCIDQPAYDCPLWPWATLCCHLARFSYPLPLFPPFFPPHFLETVAQSHPVSNIGDWRFEALIRWSETSPFFTPRVDDACNSWLTRSSKVLCELLRVSSSPFALSAAAGQVVLSK